MFPWFWLWAPQLRLPLSGDVAQDIEPRLDAFFDAIPEQAGDGRIEGQAFRVASYGHQLGVITDLLLELVRSQPGLLAQDSAALVELRRIHEEIEQVKEDEHVRELQRTLASVQAIRRRGGRAAKRLEQELAATSGRPA